MEVENGKLFMKSAYRPNKNEEKLGIDDTLIQHMSKIDSMLSIISERMDQQYGTDSTNSTYLSIKRHVALYHAFIEILELDNVAYNEYEKTPYILDESSEFILPWYDKGVVLRFDPTKVVEDASKKTNIDPNFEKIQSILWTTTVSSYIKKEADGYHINNAEVSIQWSSVDPLIVGLTTVLSLDLKTFSSPVLTYKDKTIYLLTDKKDVNEIQNVLALMPSYIARLDTILSGNPGLVGGIRFLDTTKKIAIGTYIFPLVP